VGKCKNDGQRPCCKINTSPLKIREDVGMNETKIMLAKTAKISI